jgi:hypothetical protein
VEAAMQYFFSFAVWYLKNISSRNDECMKGCVGGFRLICLKPIKFVPMAMKNARDA